MSDLPHGWEWATLGELGYEVREIVQPESGRPYELWSVPSFSVGSPEFVHGEQIGSAKLAVLPNDVLICKINPRINRVWQVSSRIDKISQIASPEWLVLRLPESCRDTTSSYLRLYLSSPRFREWIKLAVSGATGSHTRAKAASILHQKAPIPPLAEQQRIVVALEDHLSRLDAAQQILARAGLRAASLVKSLLCDAFSGKLTLSAKTSSPEEIRNAILQERLLLRSPNDRRGRPHPAPVSQELEFEIPDHWATVSLEEATHPSRNISYGILKPGPNLTDGIPYVRVVNMRDDTIAVDCLYRTSSEIDKKYQRARLSGGDVLLSIRGTYGRVALVPGSLAGANITQDTARLAFAKFVDPRFAVYYLRSPFAQAYFKKIARGVAVKGVNIGDLREMPMPLPPLCEQRLVVRLLEQHLSSIQTGQRTAADIWRRVELVRTSLMHEAFAGCLVPQEPNDEPASVLLERIRAERAAQPRSRRTRRTRQPDTIEEALL